MIRWTDRFEKFSPDNAAHLFLLVTHEVFNTGDEIVQLRFSRVVIFPGQAERSVQRKEVVPICLQLKKKLTGCLRCLGNWTFFMICSYTGICLRDMSAFTQEANFLHWFISVFCSILFIFWSDFWISVASVGRLYAPTFRNWFLIFSGLLC